VNIAWNQDKQIAKRRNIVSEKTPATATNGGFMADELKAALPAGRLEPTSRDPEKLSGI
jgi:hypothetical protein